MFVSVEYSLEMSLTTVKTVCDDAGRINICVHAAWKWAGRAVMSASAECIDSVLGLSDVDRADQTKYYTKCIKIS